ncbi:ATP-binding protein [Streptobacillus felis]|uniref:ATP-binding protein n=1 Tax=Streptobacillus felis TaxID=1384509 RepID=UPI000AE872AE|nr:ATP-binding protein [Streptobacillus felis]
MFNRKIYMDKLKKYINTEYIKVITGVRRCGKSFLLKLLKQELLNSGIDEKNIIYMNFEALEFIDILDYLKLYEYIKTRVNNDTKYYFIFDEIQKVNGWEKVINGLRVSYNSDIYITGSNSELLSGELATYLAGRYIEINMYTLSFNEFLEFKKYDKEKIDLKWKEYFEYGSFPSVVLSNDIEIKKDVLQGIYSSIVLKDISYRSNIRDVAILERIILFLLDNVGQLININKIANTLVSSGIKISNNTVQNYVDILEKSFLFYKSMRYDIQGRKYLSSNFKYYAVDTGLYTVKINKNRNYGTRLENIVFIELKRRGYDVSIGVIGKKEIDFVAKKNDELIFIQVADKLPENDDREISNLLNLKTGYKKIVIVNTYSDIGIYEGIPVIHITDFLSGMEI